MDPWLPKQSDLYIALCFETGSTKSDILYDSSIDAKKVVASDPILYSTYLYRVTSDVSTEPD